MNESVFQLISCIADGGTYSEDALCKQLQVEPEALSVLREQLACVGLDLFTGDAGELSLPGGVDLYNYGDIQTELKRLAAELAVPRVLNSFDVVDLKLLPFVSSTNQYLLDEVVGAKNCHAKVCLAEYQNSGRGRLGRQWQSPFAGGVCFSIAWRFQSVAKAAEGLSLAVGVAVAEALESLGVSGLCLKWPNDLLINKKKLGGILIELSKDAEQVVIGVGINLHMPDSLAQEIGQPCGDLSLGLESPIPSRSKIAARVIAHLASLLHVYESQGFEASKVRWEQLNAYRGQPVVLLSPQREVRGTVLGVSSSGALRLDVGGVEQTFVGGEISLRPDL
ncbi:MAG: biotin--[acetyl-CoA-carboxylase] ligase [Alteromonadaceae bacterium]|nr:MAG: biotin--[acetyl-CoA-carboxylase] ligase [Alteromonadaceae bacterium]